MIDHATHQEIALVTGANKGIGRAAAEQLAALGMTVLIGARDPRRGEEAAAAVRAAGGDAHVVIVDVNDPATARAAAKHNNHTGVLTVAQGAAVLVRLATLAADGPTGGFFADDGPVPW